VSLLPPLGLISLVLGSILFGLADTASAATFGAAGAVVAAAGSRRLGQVAIFVTVLLLLWRLLDGDQQMWPIGAGLFAVLLLVLAVAGLRCWRRGLLPDALQATLKMTSMIFAIIIGAALFSLCFKAIGGDDLLKSGVSAALNANPWLASFVGGATAEAAQARAALLFLLLLIFLLGFVLEFVEIIVVVLPLLLPLVFSVPPEHLDPAWAAILIALALQTSFLTPPFGFALFYFRGAADALVPSLALYRAVIPFIAVQLLVLALVWFFPLLALTG
ncbi:MAG: TRAP transporter large permease subunit, partial [Alphaproteobacteria bacterium]